MLADLIESGGIAWIVLVALAIEWVGLAIYQRRTGRGVPGRELAPGLLAGAGLWLALGLGLGGAGWPAIGAALALALVAHLLDLRLRWRSGGSKSGSAGL